MTSSRVENLTIPGSSTMSAGCIRAVPACALAVYPRRPDHPRSLGPRPHRHRRHTLHLLVQPEPHADQPVQGGVGGDEGVEGLVAFSVALRLPGADGPSALEAGDDVYFAPLSPKRPFPAPTPSVGFGPFATKFRTSDQWHERLSVASGHFSSDPSIVVKTNPVVVLRVIL